MSREEEPGAIHHVFARGNNKGEIFVGDFDRRCYLELLARTTSEKGWRCLSYCLMHNHVHLLVETPQPNLGAGMQRLHGDYARCFNDRHGRSGHLFQGRFGSTRITTDAYFSMVTRYIARNPVDAGLCDTPDEWRWGSHAAIAANEPPAWLDLARLLDLFGPGGRQPRRRYLEWVTTEGPR